MANHASAIKAHRQSIRRRNRNRSNRSALRTALKQFSSRLEAGPQESPKEATARLYSLVDTAAKTRTLSKNAAARQKSRLTRRLNKIAALPSAS